MKSTTVMLLAALIVLIGRWAQGKTVPATIVVGGLFSALFLSVLAGPYPQLAAGFAWLFFTGAALTYIGPVLANTQKAAK
jgi:hypothetical protein